MKLSIAHHKQALKNIRRFAEMQRLHLLAEIERFKSLKFQVLLLETQLKKAEGEHKDSFDSERYLSQKARDALKAQISQLPLEEIFKHDETTNPL